jgi:hypothetical protein
MALPRDCDIEKGEHDDPQNYFRDQTRRTRASSRGATTALAGFMLDEFRTTRGILGDPLSPVTRDSSSLKVTG